MERQERIILTVVGAVVRLLYQDVVSIKFKRLEPGQKRYLTNVKSELFGKLFKSSLLGSRALPTPEAKKTKVPRSPHRHHYEVGSGPGSTEIVPWTWSG